MAPSAGDFGTVPVDSHLPFAVDTFTSATCGKPQFLTHAHKDHCVGIEKWGRHIYCTQGTRDLLSIRFPSLDANPNVQFEIVQVNDMRCIAHGGAAFSVTPLDANHCHGAAMFAFEGDGFGCVLHTGDCRLTPETLQRLPERLLAPGGIDLLYLDCTFARNKLDFLSSEEATRQVLQLLDNHPHAPRIFLSCDGLGSESLLAAVCKHLKTQLYLLPRDCMSYFGYTSPQLQLQRWQDLNLLLPHCVTSDKSSRLHMNFGRLIKGRAGAAAQQQREGGRGGQPPLWVRPSAQEAARDCEDLLQQLGTARQRGVRAVAAPRAPLERNGVHYVLNSLHSSRSELVAAVQALRPCAVVAIAGALIDDFLPFCRESVEAVLQRIAAGMRMQVRSPHPPSLTPAAHQCRIATAASTSNVADTVVGSPQAACGQTRLATAPALPRPLQPAANFVHIVAGCTAMVPLQTREAGASEPAAARGVLAAVPTRAWAAPVSGSAGQSLGSTARSQGGAPDRAVGVSGAFLLRDECTRRLSGASACPATSAGIAPARSGPPDQRRSSSGKRGRTPSLSPTVACSPERPTCGRVNGVARDRTQALASPPAPASSAYAALQQAALVAPVDCSWAAGAGSGRTARIGRGPLHNRRRSLIPNFEEEFCLAYGKSYYNYAALPP